MISAIVGRKYPRRVIRIAQYSIEVDDGVVFPAVADPRIHRLPLGLFREGEDRKRGSRHKKPFNRCQSASVNPQTFCVSPFDELPMPLDDLIDADLFGWIDGKDVIPSQLHDHMGHTCAGERVAVETRQSVGAEGIMKGSVTGDSFVQYAHLLIARLSCQPPVTSLT